MGQCCSSSDERDEKRVSFLSPPPPPPASERNISTEGSEASKLSSSNENARRRKLFDLLCSSTEFTLKLGAKGKMDKKLNIEKVGPFLRSCKDATIIAEMWVVFRMPGKLPSKSFDAIAPLLTMLDRMDVDRTGFLNYESYSRTIQRSISQTPSLQKGSDRGSNGRASEGAGFSGSVVGMDPRAVKADARILILRMKELSKLPPGDPYVKLSLVCPLAENEYGKQLKQTAVHGASDHVMYDPPQFFGFVCEPNLNKAKLILTVMDKNVLSADTVVGSCVVHLKKLKSVKGGKEGDEDNMELNLIDVESGETMEGVVSVGIRIVSKDKGFGFGMEQVFEYERWALGHEWGSTSEHYLPTDPGQWSNEEGTFFWTLDEASRQLPTGWRAEPWRASSLFGDLGWQYSKSFRSGNWSDTKGSLTYVRRRLWYRCIHGTHSVASL